MPVHRRLVIPLLLVVALFAGACGDDDEPAVDTGDDVEETTTTAADAAEEETFTPPFEGEAANIATNFERFFASETPDEEAATLVEQAPQTEAILTAAAQAAAGQETSVEVTEITMVSDDAASVTFTLNVGATPIPGATGFAVLQDGTWRVSLSTLCSLLTLGEGGAPPECAEVEQPA